MPSATTENTTGFSNSQALQSAPSGARQWLVIGAIALVVVGGVSYYVSQKESKSMAAQNAFFVARQSMNKESQALVPPAPPAPAVDPKAAGAKPPKAPKAEDATYRKLDVDAKFPDSLKKFQVVISEFPGTRSAHEARMQIGELYFNHGQPAKALSWYQQAVQDAPNSTEKAFALNAVGASQENLNQFKEARDTFEDALKQGDPTIKAELLLSIARTSTALGDTAKAKSTYEQLLNQFPNTETATYAESLKAQLE